MKNAADAKVVKAERRFRVACWVILLLGVVLAAFLAYSVDFISGGMWGVLKELLFGAGLYDTEGWRYYPGGGLEAFARELVLLGGVLFLVALLWVIPALAGLLPLKSIFYRKGCFALGAICLALTILLVVFEVGINAHVLIALLVSCLPLFVYLIFVFLCLRT